MPDFSVIIPTCNNEAVVMRTLASVDAAIDYCRGRGGSFAAVEAEVLVVDDGSRDRTPDLVDEWMCGRVGHRLLRRNARSSASTVRNIGAAWASGPVLFFLDGDDVFLQEHIYRCLVAMQDDDIDFVKTGAELSDPVHEEWKTRIESSLVINLCIRARCHEFVGGFLDDHLFRRREDTFVHVCDVFFAIEDVFYNRLLNRFLRGARFSAATVRYHRYPGNSFDRQYEKFQVPPGEFTDAYDEQFAFRLGLANLIFEDRCRAVARKTPGVG